MKAIAYTFRTFPEIEKLRSIFPSIFVFGKLNEDFEKFSKRILEIRPDYILGIAKSPFDFSQFESLAINQFNKKKKIISDGPESYSLLAPKQNMIKISDIPGDSFCNWTAYKISHLIAENNLESKLIFLHVKMSSLDKLISMAKYYDKKII